MNVSLTPELEEFIAEEISSGMYESASDVIHAGLRLLREGNGAKRSFMVSSAEELEAKLLSGVRQLEEGKGISSDEAMRKLRKRAHSRVHGNG